MAGVATAGHARRAKRVPASATTSDPGTLRLGDGLRRSGFLRRLTGPSVEAFVKAGSVRKFGPGSLVQGQDTGADRLLFLASGAVKVHHTSESGQDRLIAIAGAGQTLNVAAVVRRAYDVNSVSTIQAAEVLAVPGDVVRDAMVRAADVGVAIAEALASEVLAQSADAATFVDLDATGRVAYRLTQLAANWGTETPQGLVIDLPLTQEELGAWAGVSRESAAKALQGFREEGVVSTGRRLLVVHALATLERLAGTADDSLAGLAERIA